MNLTPALQALIEQYLDNQLSGQALADFEEKLSMDKALAQEVAFQKDLHLLLADSPENELRKNLELLSEQVVLPKKKEDNRGIWWWLPSIGEANVFDWLFGQPQRHLVWLLPLLLLAGWWLTNNGNPIEPKDQLVGTDSLRSEPFGKPLELNPTEPKDQLVGTDSLRSEPFGKPLEINPIVEEKTEAINKDSKDTLTPSHIVQQPPKPKPKPINPRREIHYLAEEPVMTPGFEETYSSIILANKKRYELSTPPPIYWYDETVNPILDSFSLGIYFGEQSNLEALIAQNAKNNTIQVEVLQKPEIAYLSTDTTKSTLATNDLSLELKLQTKEQLLDQELVLYMKDNQGNPYGPFSLAEAVQTVDDTTYLLNTSLKLWDNTPRLAYYSIENYQTKAVYFKERLIVLPKDSILHRQLFPMKYPDEYIRLADQVNIQYPEGTDFFAPNAAYDALVEQYKTNNTWNVEFTWPIPDTLYATQLEETMQAEVSLQTNDDLLQHYLIYEVVNNLGDKVYSSRPLFKDGYFIQHKFGTDTYSLPIDIPWGENGLYYYMVYRELEDGRKYYYVGKFVYVVDNK